MKTLKLILPAAGMLFVLSGCGDGSSLDTQVAEPETTTTSDPSEQANTTTTSVATGFTASDLAAAALAGEEFIDIYLSFDSDTLLAALTTASDPTQRRLLYAQQWAGSLNYDIDRTPCEAADAFGVLTVDCRYEFDSDLLRALGLDALQGETMQIVFSEPGGDITRVVHKPEHHHVFAEALEWVAANKSEAVAGVCQGWFDGGPTPADCAGVYLEGFTEFTESADFPADS